MEGEGKDSPKPADAPGNASTAETVEEQSWWGSWGKGWIDSVKEKSASTLEMVKKDLNEFVEVIQGDTSVAISETAEKLDQHVENNKKDAEKEESNANKALHSAEEFVHQGVKGLSQVLHSMSELMAIQQDPDDANEEFITLSEGSFSLQSYNRKQEKLQLLQTDPGTYCNEPEGLFVEWLDVFSLDDHKEDMSNLLTQNPAVRAVYSRLVPDVVSHTTFWQRYYYKVFLLESEERRREELLARADKGNVDIEEDDGWGDDDDDDIEIVKHDVKSSTSAPGAVTPVKVEKDNIQNENLTADKLMSLPMQSMRNEGTCKKQVIETGNVKIAEETVDDGDIETPRIEPLNKDIKTIEHGTDDSTPEKSCEIIKDENEIFDENIDQTDSINTLSKPGSSQKSPPLLDVDTNKPETSETASISSWMSIDDDIKVKKIKEEQVVKNDRPSSDGSGSSGVLINKSEADDMDDDDFDIDLDDVDADEEELAKMVEQIKNKSKTGDLQDEDDWENWE